VTLCCPLPYGLHVATFERGRRNSRKGYGHLPCPCTGRHHDVGPVWRVSSITAGPVRPSPPLCRHLEYCNDIPVVVGALDDKTSPSPPLCALRSSVSYTLEPGYGRDSSGRRPHSHPRSRFWASTGLVTTPAESEIRQDDQQLHSTIHHTAIRSLEMCGTIVNRLPLAYKRRSRSPGRGEGGQIVAHLHFSAFTTILAFRLNQTSGA
jgi:hypothetical protein